MKQKNSKKHLVLGVVLVCAASTSAALTLGMARGAVLLGQPLSLTMAVQAQSDDDAADLCFFADVYYGETRLDSSRVSVVPVRQGSGAPTAVRVNAALPIDEPIVSVDLRSGCGQKTSRKYVFFSNLAIDLAPASTGESVAWLMSAPELAVVSGASAISSVAQPLSNANKSAAGKTSKSSKRQSAATAKPEASRPVVVQMAAAPSKSRLNVSILDLMDIKDPTLKLSNLLSALPSEDPQMRDTAIALWRSLNTSPQDLIKDESQQNALAADLKSLRDISAQNQRELQALSGRLQQAESERYFNPLVYALAALLLSAALALVAILVKLRRRDDESPWWRGDGQHDNEDREIPDASHLDLRQPSSAVHQTAAIPDTVDSPHKVETVSGAVDFSHSGLDIDLDLDDPSSVGLMAPNSVQRKEVTVAGGAKGTGVSGANRGVSQSMHASLHAINTQEMLDVRQQADFFMTLGQHEEAIGLLEGSIRENEASNPLVYLDLLKVLHTLSRKSAFDHYRNEFNGIFTGQAQAYATFGLPGNSLDSYPQICGEIAELCGTEAAVGFLEQCMMRRPEDAPEMYFDLDAFRDLLMLHAVASRISLNRISDSGLMPFSAVKIVAIPQEKELSLVATSKEILNRGVASLSLEPPEQGLEVDLDLSSDDNNLIEFEASSLSDNLPSAADKPSEP